MCENISLATKIIYNLQLIGLISGGYIGYRYGYKIKNLCCDTFSTFKFYYDKYIVNKFESSQISENTTFNLIGCCFGLLGGFYAYPFIIPITIFQLAEDYPTTFNNLKDYIKK
jgi:hypothetical protein